MNRIKLASLALAATAILATAPKADAWAFHWSKVEVKSSSWNDCMGFAEHAARSTSLSQQRRDRLGVYGASGGASATITCIGTGGNSRAMAVVMVVGDDEGPVLRLRDRLVSAVTRVQRID
jgi:hypothetical protein